MERSIPGSPRPHPFLPRVDLPAQGGQTGAAPDSYGSDPFLPQMGDVKLGWLRSRVS